MGATTLERDRCQDESEETEELNETEEGTSMKKLYSRRLGSAPITINRNGSRFISPLDIVRSKAGRAEIQRQQRPPEKDDKRTGTNATRKGETR